MTSTLMVHPVSTVSTYTRVTPVARQAILIKLSQSVNCKPMAEVELDK